jgi:signal transduction histidine kinase
VFARFVRLDAQSEGSGMGLPLVKKIVERGGGRVGVSSEPGKGSTFTFTWPKSPRIAESR